MYERYQMPFTMKNDKAEDKNEHIEEPKVDLPEARLETPKKDDTPIDRLAIFSDNTALLRSGYV